MINVLLPMSGKHKEFTEQKNIYPKSLVEIWGKSIIERVVGNLKTIEGEIRFIFVLNDWECRKFHIDKTIKILSDATSKIVTIGNETMGAACSALMAISEIDMNLPLVIANPDQLFDCQLSILMSEMQNADAGVVTFNSVHPRWSYVRLNEKNEVVEAAEKEPISRHAIAGFYYFQNAANFIDGAMRMIEKNASVEGRFYIAPVMNELILKGHKVIATPISNDCYHTLYTPEKIKEYESKLLRDAYSRN